MAFDLKNKNVLVVGGGTGIGRATAKLSAGLGANVLVASRSAERLQATVASISAGAEMRPVDMTDEVRVQAWARDLPEIDHLVISASNVAHGPFVDTPTEPIRGMFNAKFFGPYVTAREVVPKIRKGGSITLFSGILSRRPGMNCTGLGAVNGAVEALARGMALELGPDIRVNCLSPGMVKTEAYAGMSEQAREAMFEKTGASYPLRRSGEPEEIAEAVVAIMTNTFLTGQVITVDGGHTIRQYASG